MAKTADGGYRASAGQAGDGERFRMQGTALGRYLLYGRDRDFLASGRQDVTPELPQPLPVPVPPVGTTREHTRARRAPASRPTGP